MYMPYVYIKYDQKRVINGELENGKAVVNF
jgi:hypothetical protein